MFAHPVRAGYMWANPANDGKPLSDFTTLESLPFLFGCPYNDTDPTNADHMLSTPYMTDIVPVPAHSWAIVRVKFDNPGELRVQRRSLGRLVITRPSPGLSEESLASVHDHGLTHRS